VFFNSTQDNDGGLQPVTISPLGSSLPTFRASLPNEPWAVPAMTAARFFAGMHAI
jgi:hypothetical protein